MKWRQKFLLTFFACLCFFNNKKKKAHHTPPAFPLVFRRFACFENFFYRRQRAI